MNDEKLLEQLDGQIDYYKSKLQDIINDIIAVIEADIPYFLSEKVKDLFLDNTEFAETFSDEQIKKLKIAIGEESKNAQKATVEALKSLEPWIVPTVTTGNNSSLEQNEAIWSILSYIGTYAEKILKDFNFPKKEKIFYREPKRFIKGKFLKSLTEKYWELLEEIAKTERKKNDIVKNAKKDKLLNRWNKF